MPSPRTRRRSTTTRCERLDGINWLRVIGKAPGKGAILSFTVDGAHAHDVAQILDRYGVAVRAGTHCAEPLMRRFGVTSSAGPPSPYITPRTRPTPSSTP